MNRQYTFARSTLVRAARRFAVAAILAMVGGSISHAQSTSLYPATQYPATLLTALEDNSGSDGWIAHLKFLSTFDRGLEADLSGGDKRIHTAKDINRQESTPGNQIRDITIVENEGRYGHALKFQKKTKPTLFYFGQSIGYRPENWSGTLSVWMKLDPDQDLRPGYCDPVLLTDKQWDQSALFIDFDKDLPRDFRLGAFPDFEVWNPSKTPWDKIAVADRPMVVVNKPPFASDRWTQVCFTWEGANLADDQSGKASLYLNGQFQGAHQQVMRFTWQPDKVAIQIGINYIGLMDELAVFDEALSESQVKRLYELPGGLLQHVPNVH